MGKYRKRFNERARAGMVKKQLELKKARNKWMYQDDGDESKTDNVQEPVIEPADPNAETLLPISKEEKAARKRELEEILKPAESKWSSQKKKRLDKYIDRQIKKQEKAEILSKLSESTVDTSMFKSLKALGQGRETKREVFEDALAKEQRGEGDEETKAILYEEKEVPEWEDADIGPGRKGEDDEKEEEDEPVRSTFIDYRPQNAAGKTGFGFQGLKTVAKPKKPKYNWRARLEQEKARKHGADIYTNDVGSTSEDESESDSETGSNEDEATEDSEEFEEWGGFDQDEVQSNEVHAGEDHDDDESADDDNEEEESDDDDHDEEDEDDEEEEEDDDDDEDENGDDNENTVSKGRAFKEWVANVTQQNHEVVPTPKYNGEYKPIDRPEDKEELPAEYKVPEHSVSRKSYFVNVQRSEEIQLARLKLPVVGEEQRIMEAIFNNDCVVICGETGSGKTTQVPQFLFEAGFGSKGSGNEGMIGITQPRRVAAVSMAQRVATELGDHGEKVAYQVRFDTSVKDTTAIKFMTDGVLLRELASDLTLSKYSVVVIDEAHERNINTDILIGVLSRVMKLRKEMSESDPNVRPLKLVIMSATLRVSDFVDNTRLFATPPPVLNVQARQFPVSVHFNRRTKPDYLEEAYRKAVKIHQKLPPGGILIFLTSQSEINHVCAKLRKAFPAKTATKTVDETQVEVRVSAKDSVVEAEDVNFGAEDDDIVDLEDDQDQNRNQNQGDVRDDYDDESEDEEGFDEQPEEGHDANAPLHVLPLYSLLPTKQQMKVFEAPPEGSRLCVVATNVAETSITIPGIRYVVDCGRAKERHYDDDTGVQSFRVSWISKAGASQRAGRAGRTGPGHCYRIYSSAIYESAFDQFGVPEIMRMPIEGVVLQMKSMGIHNIVNFPFPTPPPGQALRKGVDLLRYLGALGSNDEVTDLGKRMSLFPLTPRFAKILLIANQFGCLPYVIALVSALSVGDPFLSSSELGLDVRDNEDEDDDGDESTVSDKEARRALRSKYNSIQAMFATINGVNGTVGDAFKVLSAVCRYDWEADREQFAKNHFLRYKLMEEIRKLRQQLSYIVAVNTRPDAVDKYKATLDAKLGPPTPAQVTAMRQMIAAGFIDQVAIRADLLALDIHLRSGTPISLYPYKSLFPVQPAGLPRGEIDPFVYIHPNSSLTLSGGSPPSYLVYSSAHLSESHKASSATPQKVRMKVLCDITANELANVSRSSALLTYSKPLGAPYAPRTITPTKRECWVVPRFGATVGSGGVGWDLPPKKVIQEKEGPHWVVKA